MAHDARILEALRAKWETLAGPPEVIHRLRRSISWLERASAEDDADTKCILLWVSFNAAYAIERKAAVTAWGEAGASERALQRRFFKRLTTAGWKRIHDPIRTSLWRAVPSLMSNEYVYRGFWDSLTDQRFDWERWERKDDFEAERDEVPKLLRTANERSTGTLLRFVFNRLYVVRNQLMHGCATREESLNRRQVEDGAEILSVLMPRFLDIMADHPNRDWGAISYPVRDDIREDLR